MADYPSGQRGLTVNQLALPSLVRIQYLPLMLSRSKTSDFSEVFLFLRFSLGAARGAGRSFVILELDQQKSPEADHG